MGHRRRRAVDDTARSAAAELGVAYHEAPNDSMVGELLDGVRLLAPSPGVPESHLVVTGAARREVPIRSEIDLAWEWEQQRPSGPRPMLAVTGTDGKTTTTLLTVEMLRAAGLRSVDAGNTDTPLVTAIEDDSYDAFVVECTSFRLAFTQVFRPVAAVWLNLAEDHQDWHASMDTYRAAKARMWRFQSPDDTAIGFAADPIVLGELSLAPGRHRTFGLSDADYRVESGWLMGPTGRIAPVSAMARSLPHDLTNALAASALVLESGLADRDAVTRALGSFRAPAHRLQQVGERDGIRYFSDSKATTPHAVQTALRAFDSVVLIAGGKNKGLDLAPLASEPQRMRAVVAIGASADLVARTFDGICPVVEAGSMAEAVSLATGLARSGDVVLLSPGCASFDWYSGYPARGDDFVARVEDLLAQPGQPAQPVPATSPHEEPR
ncbi:MAG: UDP-N-acetylmuramoyl-L-alanine--D-glutamate ligase [Ilumatobacteraceae bacterium]